MHSALVINDEASLEELNRLLAEGEWWVDKIAPGNDGSWLVVLTDRDPDILLEEPAIEEDAFYSEERR